ncbi:MAG: homoserine kinase, partial [Dehalococcoidia bacterium]|nr:homoserine kinase [Dehalococcoidia bacterium]
MSVTVAVPATTANLGPGFDCLGMALGLENRLTLEVSDAPRIVVRGEGEHDLRRTPTNLAYRAAQIGYALSGHAAPPFALTLDNAAPLARGL